MLNKVNRYECYELQLDEGDQITLYCPDGSEQTIYAFDKQNIHMEYDEEGIETVIKDGAPYKAIRFFPEQCGEYIIKGKAFENRIQVVEGENRGYIKVSDKNPKYLSYSDNTLFFAIGINLAFISPVSISTGEEFGVSSKTKFLGLRHYERWFKKCAENGVNMARIWLGHEYFCVDTQNTGEFNLVNFSKIDMLMDLAKKYNIKLKLTLEQFRYFDYTKKVIGDSYSNNVFKMFNKTLYHNGKRCESIDEWLTEDIWKKSWTEKVAELAKRIAGNTTVFAIELWNEMNALGDENVINWNKELMPKVKELFLQHLVINSLGSYDCDRAKNSYEKFCWEHSDIKQMHRYLDQGAEYLVCRDSLIDMLTKGFNDLDDSTKPFLVSETGAVNNCHSGPFKYYCCDHKGILFCDSVYTPVFSGACGIGNIWHWNDKYVESKNLYKYFYPISNLCDEIDFINEEFKSEVYQNDNAVLLLLSGKNTAIGYLRNKSYNWKNILRDLKDAEPIEEFSILIDEYSHLETVDIWDDETASAEFNNGKLIIKNIRYGLFIKLLK